MWSPLLDKDGGATATIPKTLSLITASLTHCSSFSHTQISQRGRGKKGGEPTFTPKRDWPPCLHTPFFSAPVLGPASLSQWAGRGLCHKAKPELPLCHGRRWNQLEHTSTNDDQRRKGENRGGSRSPPKCGPQFPSPSNRHLAWLTSKGAFRLFSVWIYHMGVSFFLHLFAFVTSPRNPNVL